MDLQQIKNKYRVIGQHPALNFALEVAIQASKTDLSVLILGESGVGKEVFSKIIHSNSQRKHNNFIAINCGALPEGTIDSELFGHEKGSFTGATDARKGYFETTNEGTIFLDEIGEMPLNTQARLLRVLESGEYIRVGASEVKKTNVRIIAATNKNLLYLIEKGKFREDLYYRLSTIPIRVPSLVDRKEDILLLFRFFANEFAQKYHTKPIQLKEEAKEKLLQYRFPGNIRELKNIVERLSVFSDNNKLLSLENFNKVALITDYEISPVLYTKGNAINNEPQKEQDVLYKMFFELKKDVGTLQNILVQIIKNNDLNPHGTEDNALNSNYKLNNVNSGGVMHPMVIKSSNNNTTFVEDNKEENLNLVDKEKEFIIKALLKHKGVRKNAAQELGLSTRTLFRKIKDYDITE